MKIVALSDTHNRHRQLKEFKDVDSMGQDKEPMGGDIIIHSGDATMGPRNAPEVWLRETKNFLEWYGELDFAHRVFTPGNHDWLFQMQPDIARAICEEKGVTLLVDQELIVDGIKIWGSPVQPEFFNWAFNRKRGEEIKRHWDMIPDGTDILVTHGPPHGVLDEVLRFDGSHYNPPHRVGCEDLRDAVRRIKPSLHIFGHIHCGAGEKHFGGTSFYNASICDETYSPTNKVTIIDFTKEGV